MTHKIQAGSRIIELTDEELDTIRLYSNGLCLVKDIRSFVEDHDHSEDEFDGVTLTDLQIAEAADIAEYDIQKNEPFWELYWECIANSIQQVLEGDDEDEAI